MKKKWSDRHIGYEGMKVDGHLWNLTIKTKSERSVKYRPVEAQPLSWDKSDFLIS